MRWEQTSLTAWKQDCLNTPKQKNTQLCQVVVQGYSMGSLSSESRPLTAQTQSLRLLQMNILSFKPPLILTQAYNHHLYTFMSHCNASLNVFLRTCKSLHYIPDTMSWISKSIFEFYISKFIADIHAKIYTKQTYLIYPAQYFQSDNKSMYL